jgi:hypothetical protein
MALQDVQQSTETDDPQVGSDALSFIHGFFSALPAAGDVFMYLLLLMQDDET